MHRECSVYVPSVSPLTNQLSIVGWLRGTVVYILVNQYRRLAYNRVSYSKGVYTNRIARTAIANHIQQKTEIISSRGCLKICWYNFL